jgi:hypothetical protein
MVVAAMACAPAMPSLGQERWTEVPTASFRERRRGSVRRWLAGEHCLDLDRYAVLAASALNRKKWASPVAVAVVVEMTVIVKVPVLAVVLEMMAIVKVAVVVAVAEAALARKKWTSPEMEVDAMGIMMLVLAPLVETAALAQMQWRALQRTEEVGVMMAPAVESATAGVLARMQWASRAVVVEAAAALTLAR